MTTNTRNLLALTAACGVVVACSSAGQPQGLSENHSTVRETDGTISFYRGRDIAMRLASAQQLGTGESESYMRLRVSQALVEAAATRPKGLLTISLEKKRTNEIVEITLYTNALSREPSQFETIVLNAADPFVTGYAQVVNQSPDMQEGYFEVKRWVRSTIESFAEQIWTTGIFADPGAPVLEFNGPPDSWPAVPADWE